MSFGRLFMKSIHPFKKISTRITVLHIYLDTSEQPIKKLYSLILQYAVRKSNTIIKTMDNSLKRILLDNVKTRVANTGQKLAKKCQIKNKTIDNTNMILFITAEPSCNRLI